MNTNQNTKRRWAKPATAIAGTALVATLTAAPAYAWQLHSTVSGNIKHAEFMPAGHQAAATESKGENILLIGAATKTRGVANNGMFVLAHVSEDRQRLDLVQFPRDSKVRPHKELQQIPTNGNEKVAVKTIEGMTNVHIDHVAKLGWDNLRDLVDAVGGVTVDGTTMNGDQALAWLRADAADTTGQDVNQGDRQMVFLKAVMSKAVSSGVLTDPVKLAHYVDVATQEMTVDKDWQVTDMEKLALSMKDITSSNVHTWTAPMTDNAQMNILGDHLRADTMADYTAK